MPRRVGNGTADGFSAGTSRADCARESCLGLIPSFASPPFTHGTLSPLPQSSPSTGSPAEERGTTSGRCKNSMESVLWFCKSYLRFVASIAFKTLKTNLSVGWATFVQDKILQALRKRVEDVRLYRTTFLIAGCTGIAPERGSDYYDSAPGANFNY